MDVSVLRSPMIVIVPHPITNAIDVICTQWRRSSRNSFRSRVRIVGLATN
jgi:hypothetical protein